MFSDNMILYIENPKESTQCTIRTKNLAKLQNTRSIFKKNQFYYYILAINHSKLKLRREFHLKEPQKEKTHRSKFNKRAIFTQ